MTETDHLHSTTSTTAPTIKRRLLSLDALRGLDLFLLCGLGPIFNAFRWGPFQKSFESSPFLQKLAEQFNHVDWVGFTMEDLIMPLFLFMAGVTIPFSMAKFKRGEDSNAKPMKLVFRLVKRIVLLWVFGMAVQGNLLNFQWEGLRLYSNTLQAIAAGYLIAVIVYFITDRIRNQSIVLIVLMFLFWAAMTWITVSYQGVTYGGGSFAKDTNLAELIDRLVLGRWRDGVTLLEDGGYEFSESYHYTWILSSLTFGATVLLGMISGEVVRKHSNPDATAKSGQGHSTAFFFVGLGALLTLIGWGWAKVPEGYFGYCPLVKHLWTPSMVLYAGGISIFLLGIFYEIYDVLHLPLLKTFFVVIGVNSITIYMIHSIFEDFGYEITRLIGGLQHHLGVWYEPVRHLLMFAFVWYILWLLYRSKKFFRL